MTSTPTDVRRRSDTASTVGTSVERVDGLSKVTGEARYSYEIPSKGVRYGWIVGSTIASGRITAIDDSATLADPEVLAVIDHRSAPRLRAVGDTELEILQSDAVRFHGQVIAIVVATSPEAAREGAEQLQVSYEQRPHSVVLDPDGPTVYTPEWVNGLNERAVTEFGEIDKELSEAAVSIDSAYTTPPHHTSPMEPHATMARWDGDDLLLHNSDQAPYVTTTILAPLLGLAPEHIRVVTEHIGGGFGSKFTPRAVPVAATLAAKVVGAPVKIALTRQQMFSLACHRTETQQRVQLGADIDGRLRALVHTASQYTSQSFEFVENTATSSRMLYSAVARRTHHTVGRLDVPTPGPVRTPGHAVGLFALETAMDELALALELDPVELRLRNIPERDPDTGEAWSSHGLAECLRLGARTFGWGDRDPRIGTRRRGRWLLGTGMASSTHPDYTFPAVATVRVEEDGSVVAKVAGADIGTGARTALTQLTAEEFGLPLSQVTVLLGDSTYGEAPPAGGSAGTSSWTWPIITAARELTAQLDRAHGVVPRGGLEVTANSADALAKRTTLSRHTFGAQFAEVAVDIDSGEVRVERLHGTFAAGRIINTRTTRSQFMGGMIMGVGMALHEAGHLDPEFGDFVNHDLASYHVPAHADVRDVWADWIDEVDEGLNPAGVKGVGEVGITGTAAAIGNAVHHATGVRLRNLPFTIEGVRAGLTA
ncbi:xanthine dehydrogenase family protein molybdopterin-binding subunit [Saccharopolyspora dendranthemae]|uniref:Xanthine dehydrogenase YagR molybdenum-binding subunit n=1 Tax=Saccharopolyspora dendranthemae TaxID=1181886 RepID=A0A561V7J0_9PSEU|nr:xanthine dehydrogenase family protein molybdopterin-binding subunit [Saccharopolyspora dendranthemae]TWG07586.1 xanthine dehydrogenase YagR molybdenum-binding subunit [Saccharopolyspora dendranthemae]